MTEPGPTPRGRGAATNPPNRFERFTVERDADWDPMGDAAPRTVFYRDRSASAITYNDSPDLGFSASLNPYRGCEHGCAYCYARPTHEYLGWSAGLDFETRLLIKEDAPELLRRELASAKWKPQVLALSGVTDPYQPVERRLQITRRCLAVLAECGNPVGLITKNRLITRDVDLLADLARHQAVAVNFSLTSLDANLLRRLEPRAASPDGRLAAIRLLADAGVPVGVLVAPVIPGLNDHEIPRVLAAAAAAGATWAGFTLLRLPLAVAPLFTDWLERNEPGRKETILARLRGLRDGDLSDSRFGARMKGEGPAAQRLSQLFDVARRRAGLTSSGPDLSTSAFRRPLTAQLDLFPDSAS